MCQVVNPLPKGEGILSFKLNGLTNYSTNPLMASSKSIDHAKTPCV